jgi:hypothetical protein
MADDRLIAMLQGAKNVMNKVEEKGFKRGTQGHVAQGITSDQLVESIDPRMAQQTAQMQQPRREPTQQELQAQLQAQMQTMQPNQYAPRPAAQPIPQTYKNLNTTKMPPSIVEAMVKNPQQVKIPASLGGEAFSIDDVAALVNPQQQYQQVNNQVNERIQQPQTIQSGVNQYGQKTITLTEAELDAKIKNALFEFMSTTFTKTLTEATIKKTMGMLIREGKLKVTQKKKV